MPAYDTTENLKDENVKPDILPSQGFYAGMPQEELFKQLNDLNTRLKRSERQFSRDPRSLASGLFNQNNVNPGHRHFPISVTLTDGASVTLIANKGDIFYLLAAGNRTILSPSFVGGVAGTFRNGQEIIIAHEASGADRTLTLTTGAAGAFRFGTDITALTATTSGLVDYIKAIYNLNDARWDVTALIRGF